MRNATRAAVSILALAVSAALVSGCSEKKEEKKAAEPARHEEPAPAPQQGMSGMGGMSGMSGTNGQQGMGGMGGQEGMSGDKK